MSFAATTSRQQAMCYGNALLHEMFGLCLKAKLRSAGTSLATSSSSFNRCSRSLIPSSWKNMAWAIWNARNKYYFEQVQVHTVVIFMSANWFVGGISTINGCAGVTGCLVLVFGGLGLLLSLYFRSLGPSFLGHHCM